IVYIHMVGTYSRRGKSFMGLASSFFYGVLFIPSSVSCKKTHKGLVLILKQEVLLSFSTSAGLSIIFISPLLYTQIPCTLFSIFLFLLMNTYLKYNTKIAIKKLKITIPFCSFNGFSYMLSVWQL